MQALVQAATREFAGFSWHVDIEYLQRVEDFWAAARENEGQITELVFEFHPPNGLGGFDKFKELDKIAKQEANGESSSYSLQNRDGGIVPRGDFVESAAEYSSEGGGATILKRGRRVIFNSRRHKREIEVPQELMPTSGEVAKVLALLAFLLKGRVD